MCSERRRVSWAAGSCARSASCGRVPIGPQNLVNIRRMVTLERIAAV
jgi:hypothetical protein